MKISTDRRATYRNKTKLLVSFGSSVLGYTFNDMSSNNRETVKVKNLSVIKDNDVSSILRFELVEKESNLLRHAKLTFKFICDHYNATKEDVNNYLQTNIIA